jgi:hypothetical protein
MKAQYTQSVERTVQACVEIGVNFRSGTNVATETATESGATIIGTSLAQATGCCSKFQFCTRFYFFCFNPLRILCFGWPGLLRSCSVRRRDRDSV